MGLAQPLTVTGMFLESVLAVPGESHRALYSEGLSEQSCKTQGGVAELELGQGGHLGKVTYIWLRLALGDTL